jgi:hypothetical protein
LVLKSLLTANPERPASSVVVVFAAIHLTLIVTKVWVLDNIHRFDNGHVSVRQLPCHDQMS